MYLQIHHFIVAILIILPEYQTFASLELVEYDLQENTELLECIGRVSIYIEYKTALIVSSDLPEYIWNKYGALMLTNSKIYSYYLQNKYVFDAYFIVFGNIEDLEEWLGNMLSKTYWNPRSRFVISISGSKNISEIFRTTWKFYILNIIVLVESEDDITLYTHFPYSNDSCEIEFHPKYISTCELLTGTVNLYPNKILHKFKGCEFTLIARKMPPYKINTDRKHRHNLKKAGVAVKLMNSIADILNLTEIYSDLYYTDTGTRLSNGTFTKVLKHLIERDVDTALCVMAFNEFPEFETSYPYFSDDIGWFVPVAEIKPKWLNLIAVYPPLLWIYINLSIILNGCTWFLFAKIYEKSAYYNQFSNCMLSTWQVYLQSCIVAPKSFIMRQLLFFWLYFSIVMYAVFQGRLVSVLTKPQFEKQIETLSDIFEAGLKIGITPGFVQSFMDPNNSIHKKILEDYIECSYAEECVNRTAFQRDMAIAKSRRQVNYYINQNITNPDGSSMLYALEERFEVSIRSIFAKGYPLLERFDNIAMSFIENGILRKWEDEFKYTKIQPTSEGPEPLKLEHLQFGFVFLGIGFILALVVFLTELLRSTR